MAAKTKKPNPLKTRKTVYDVKPEDLYIVETKGHRLFDPRSDYEIDKETLASIQEVGVLVDVLIAKIPHPEVEGEAVIALVDGRQRTNAALQVKSFRAAGLEGFEGDPDDVTVPCKLVADLSKIKDPEKLDEGMKILQDMAQITNEFRTDDDDVVKAYKVAAYLASGRTLDEASANFKISKSHVKNFQRLDKACAKVKKLVKQQKLTLTDVTKEKLHTVPAAEIDAKLETVTLREVNPTTGKASRPRKPKADKPAPKTKTKDTKPAAAEDDNYDPYAEQVPRTLGELLGLSGDPEAEEGSDWAAAAKGISKQTCEALQWACGLLSPDEITDKALLAAIKATV